MDFTISTEQSLEEYLLFNKTVKKANTGTRIMRWFTILAAVITDINACLGIIYGLIARDYSTVLLEIVLAVFVNLMAFVYPNWHAKRFYKTHHQMQNVRKELHFTEEEVEIHGTADHQETTYKARYENCLRLIENSSTLYLMFDKGSGEIVPKSKLTDSQIIFLRKKFVGRFKKIR